MSDEPATPKRDTPTCGALKNLYRRHLGELAWIEAPPKTIGRKSRSGGGFEAKAPDRVARAEKIREALPHIAYVVGLYDPAWDPLTAKPIRPHAKHRATPKPSVGWPLATLAVLRDVGEPLTVAEIVVLICDKYDIDNPTTLDRQRCHTAVNQALRRKEKEGRVIRCHGSAIRWSIR